MGANGGLPGACRGFFDHGQGGWHDVPRNEGGNAPRSHATDRRTQAAADRGAHSQRFQESGRERPSQSFSPSHSPEASQGYIGHVGTGRKELPDLAEFCLVFLMRTVGSPFRGGIVKILSVIIWLRAAALANRVSPSGSSSSARRLGEIGHPLDRLAARASRDRRHPPLGIDQNVQRRVRLLGTIPSPSLGIGQVDRQLGLDLVDGRADATGLIRFDGRRDQGESPMALELTRGAVPAPPRSIARRTSRPPRRSSRPPCRADRPARAAQTYSGREGARAGRYRRQPAASGLSTARHGTRMPPAGPRP